MKRTATAAVNRERAGGTTVIRTLLWCLYGLLVPRALLYGEMAPFGISLAAAASTGAVPITVATLVGYLLAGDTLYPLRYVTALLMVAGARWVLSAVPEWKGRPLVSALLAFVSTLSTGLVMLGAAGLDGYRVLLMVAESAVAAGCAVFFSTAMGLQPREPLTQPRQAAVILTGAIGVMAVATLSVGGFSPGRVLAVLLVLVLARTGRETGGCMAGVILGAAVALSAPGQTVPAMAMAAGGLTAGVFARFGRAAAAAALLLTGGVVTLMEVSDNALMYIYELLAAGVLFTVLPRRLDHALSHLLLRRGEEAAVTGLRTAVTLHLGVAARAIRQVSDTVDAVATRLARHGAADVVSVLEGACAATCGTCPLQAKCHGQDRQQLLAALDAAGAHLRQQGQVTVQELSGHLRQHCRRQERLAEELTHRYEQHVARAAGWQRIAELRGALRDQFGATGELLDALAARLDDPRQVDVEMAERVLTVCGDYGMPATAALCTLGAGNRLTVEILTPTVEVCTDKGRWLRDIQRACARTFDTPTVTHGEGEARITLTEPPRYRVERGQTQLCCSGETLCGDAVDVFALGGETVVMLSDGMGSGGRAAVDGAMAVGLCARLWQAGFSADSTVKTVNASLMVKSREESLATMDVAVIDGFTGRLDSFKAGASASLLRSKGRISRLERPSLPLGILPDAAFSHSHDWLAVGDILLLCSDGAYPDGVAAVEQLLAAHPEGDSMQALADRVAAAARAADTRHPDDITVIALRLTENKER